jgi:hypothetical protein
MIDWMAGQGVEPSNSPCRPRLEDYAWLKERAKIPIFGDEPHPALRSARIAPYFTARQRQDREVRRRPGAVRLAGLARAWG